MTTARRPPREIDATSRIVQADLDARQALYQQLAERIWSPERLAREVAS